MGDWKDDELAAAGREEDRGPPCEACKGSGRILVMMAYSTTPPFTGCSACGGSGNASDTTPESVAAVLAMFED